jgi:hypothetical protein
VYIEFDASIYGGGAAMWRGIEARRREQPPAEWFAVTWDESWGKLVGASPGDAAHQASWEALCLFISARLWIEDAPGPAYMVGDAEGILFDLIQMRGRSRIINDVAKELALYLAPLGKDLYGMHVWGVQNKVADELSRLSETKEESKLIAWLRWASVQRALPPLEEWDLQILGQDLDSPQTKAS